MKRMKHCNLKAIYLLIYHVNTSKFVWERPWLENYSAKRTEFVNVSRWALSQLFDTKMFLSIKHTQNATVK